MLDVYGGLWRLVQDTVRLWIDRNPSWISRQLQLAPMLKFVGDAAQAASADSGFHSHGGTPNSWMVYFRENPPQINSHPILGNLQLRVECMFLGTPC